MQSNQTKKWLCLVIGVLMMMLLGLIYAWSNFVRPLEAEFGWLRSQTSFTFTMSIIFFVVGLNASARISKAKSTRVTMLISALSMMAGFILSSMVKSPVQLYGSYGVLVGFGVGLAYNTILPVVIQWFPGQRSTISGILLMGFGMGGLILGPTLVLAMSAIGWKQTFVVLGVVFAVMTVLSSLILQAPAQSGNVAGGAPVADRESDFTTAEMVRRASFWITMLWFTSICSGGLMVISNGSPYAQSMGLTPEVAAIAVGVINLSNGFGRILSGVLCDRAGIKVSLTLNSIFLLLAAALLRTTVSTSILPLLFVGYSLAGLSYGGVPTTISALAAEYYGQRNFASNYAVLSAGLIPGSLAGPALAGVLLEKTGGYGIPFLFMLVLGVAGLLFTGLIKKPVKSAA